MKLKLVPYKKTDRDAIWQIYVDAMKYHIEKIWGWDLTWQKKDFAKALEKYTTAIIKLGEIEIGYI